MGRCIREVDGIGINVAGCRKAKYGNFFVVPFGEVIELARSLVFAMNPKVGIGPYGGHLNITADARRVEREKDENRNNPPSVAHYPGGFACMLISEEDKKRYQARRIETEARIDAWQAQYPLDAFGNEIP